MVAAVAGVMCTSIAAADDSGRTYIDPPASPAGVSAPFSEAVVAGDTLYVAGHIALDPTTHKAFEATDSEARAVMDAVKHSIESAGFTMDDLVSVTVYCTDLQLFDSFNAIYRGYFHGHYPARAFIGVAALLRGAHFDVAGIATKPRHHR